MKFTNNYNLNLPDLADQYNLEHWNENTNKIDTLIKEEVDARINNAETRAKNLANATGILAIDNGGTGSTTAKGANYNLIKDSVSETNDLTDDSLLLGLYASPSATIGASYKRTGLTVWNYIKRKINLVSGLILNASILKGDVSFSEINGSQKGYMPIGTVYTQYPLQKAPSELFVGTWSDISSKYKGLFTRIAGGDAVEFEKKVSISSMSGTTLTLIDGHGVTTGCILVDSEGDEPTYEQRSVTNVNGNTITIDSAFSKNLTTVLILQAPGLPNITGTFNVDDEGKDQVSGAFYITETIYGPSGNGSAGRKVAFDASLSNAIYGNSETVQPLNATIKLWKRIN